MNGDTWLLHRGNPVKQSNFGVYKQVISKGEGANLKRVTLTGDTPEIVQAAAIAAAVSHKLLAALECEIALDATYEAGQSVFKRHGYIKIEGETAMKWVRKLTKEAIAQAKVAL